MSNGVILRGRKYDWKTGLGANFTQQEQDVPTVDGQAPLSGTIEVIPTDRGAARVNTYTINATELDAYFLGFPGNTQIRVPNVLLAIATTFNSASGSGSFSETGAGQSAGSYATLSLQIRGSGQGSAAVIPKIIPNITEYWGQNKPVIQYTFFVPTTAGVASLATVLAKLTTVLGTPVNAWPNFQPKSHTFVLSGSRVTLAVQAQIQQYVYISAANVSRTSSTGTGGDYDVSLSTESVDIPSCLHGSITLSPTSAVLAAAAAASVAFTGGTNWNAMSESPSESANAGGSITPTSVSATSPTAPPGSGLYLHDIHVEAYTTGYALVVAEVFNFADL